MLFYVLLVGSMFVAAAGLTFLGMGSVAVWMFPMPVAWYWALGRRRASLGLVAAASLAGAVGGQHELPALLFGTWAFTGVALGESLARRRSYGWSVAAMAGSASALTLGLLVANWDGWIAAGSLFRDAMVQAVHANADEALTSQQQLVLERIDVLAQAWPYVSLGVTFMFLLFGSTVITSALRLGLQTVKGVPAFPGSFVAARPPEWLVWAVIATAGLWFWDHYWPYSPVRIVAWNGAICLLAVYLLNGASIFGYGVQAFKPPLWLSIPTGLLVFLRLPYFVAFIGLFDTWSAFRVKFDKLVEARHVRKQQDDDSWF